MKWEYAELRITPSTLSLKTGGTDARLTIFAKDGSHRELPKGQFYGQMLAEMGDDGWEVVSATTQTYQSGLSAGWATIYLLKRPKE